MNKSVVTNTEEENKGNRENEEKKGEKITLEGWLLYFILFLAIAGLPIGSTIWILSVANSDYVP